MSWIITGTEKTPVDPYFSNVSLLLHGNGTNGSTTIIDSSPSPKTVTAVGNAQISTAQSKFGGASITFDGSGDYLTLLNSTGFDFETADFTVELFFRSTSNATDKFILSSSAAGGFFFGFRTGGSTNGYGIGRNGIAWDVESGVLPSLNTWEHVAYTRSGSTLRIFVEGTQVVTATNSLTYGLNGGGVRVGLLDSGRTLAGQIDDLRITKGVARYTANFTPPTAPFPDF